MSLSLHLTRAAQRVVELLMENFEAIFGDCKVVCKKFVVRQAQDRLCVNESMYVRV